MGKIIFWGIGLISLILFPSFGLWYFIIAGIIWSSDVNTESSSGSGSCSGGRCSDSDSAASSRLYSDGTRCFENLSGTGYIYTNGEESWIDSLGSEHRSNGDIVMDNAYIPGQRDIYRDGQCIGHEYESNGITRRY